MNLITRFSAVSPRRRWRAACAAAIGATALATGLTVAPMAAQADQPPNAAVSSVRALPVSGVYSRYQDYATGLCLDGNYTNSYTNPCYGGGDTYQEWAYFITEYTSTLQDYQTGRCLDGNYAGAVYTSPCDGDDTYQNWNFGGQGPGYTIQDYQTGRCLDSNSSDSDYTSPCNWNNNYENWTPVS
jgi:hypothetical protein